MSVFIMQPHNRVWASWPYYTAVPFANGLARWLAPVRQHAPLYRLAPAPEPLTPEPLAPAAARASPPPVVPPYTAVKELNPLEDSTFVVLLVKYRGMVAVLKKIKYTEHNWYGAEGFTDRFRNEDALFQRLSEIYKTMGDLGIGPEVYEIVVDPSTHELLVFMEYLPSKLTRDYTISHVAEIFELVRTLHGAGFVHGDLHHQNIRVDSQGRPRLIDFDTTFRPSEFREPFIRSWMELYGFTRQDAFLGAEKVIFLTVLQQSSSE